MRVGRCNKVAVLLAVTMIRGVFGTGRLAEGTSSAAPSIGMGPAEASLTRYYPHIFDFMRGVWTEAELRRHVESLSQDDLKWWKKESILRLGKWFSEAKYKKKGILEGLAKKDGVVKKYIDWLKDSRITWNVDVPVRGAEKKHIDEYGYVCYSDVVLGPIIDFVGGDEVLEVGGGTGFLARLLRLAGVDVVCTDASVAGENVIELDAMNAIDTYNRPVLLVSWLTNDSLSIYGSGSIPRGGGENYCYKDGGYNLLEKFKGSRIISISSLRESKFMMSSSATQDSGRKKFMLSSSLTQDYGWKIVHRQAVDCMAEKGLLTFYERDERVGASSVAQSIDMESEKVKERFLRTDFGRLYCSEESIEISSRGKCDCSEREVRFNVVLGGAVEEEVRKEFVEWCKKGKVVVIREGNGKYCERMGLIEGHRLGIGELEYGNLPLIRLNLSSEWAYRHEIKVGSESLCNVHKIIDIVDENLEHASFEVEVTIEDLMWKLAYYLPKACEFENIPSAKQRKPVHCVWVYRIHSMKKRHVKSLLTTE